MSCNLRIEEEEPVDEEAQAQDQHPNASFISPTQHLTQASPPSSHSHPTDPTYLLTAAAATMQNQEGTAGQSSLQAAINNEEETTAANAETNNATAAASTASAAVSTSNDNTNNADDDNNNNNITAEEQSPTFDALSAVAWWRRGNLFARSDALALIPTLDENNHYNIIFNDLIGDELKQHVPHAINLIRAIIRIADHDWNLPNQIPSDTDLSALSGMYHLMPLHQELLELHIDRKYKPAGVRGCGGGGGGDDKGDDSGEDDFDEDEDDEEEDPYGTDKTDKDYDDVTPPNSDKDKWEKALIKKRSQRKVCKQWDIIRIVWDGLLHCYEMQIRALREHHLRTRNKARKMTQVMAEMRKGKISDEEVSYMVVCFHMFNRILTNPSSVPGMLVLRATVQAATGCPTPDEGGKRLVHQMQESCQEIGNPIQGPRCQWCNSSSHCSG